MTNFDLITVKKFIQNHPNAKIYIGCDSIRMKKKKYRYATVVCVHYEGSKGAKVFAKIDYDKIIDAQANKPINRMIKEVEHVIEIYNELEEVLYDKEFEIHIDINPDEKHGSNIAYGTAKGMIQGVIGVMPKFKPFAFASTCAADKFCKK